MNQYLDFEKPIAELETKIGELREYSTDSVDFSSDIQKLEKKADKLKTEIYSKLDIEQASASHHLNILKNKGVLVSKREGKKIYYSLKSVTLTEIIECINRCNEE